MPSSTRKAHNVFEVPGHGRSGANMFLRDYNSAMIVIALMPQRYRAHLLAVENRLAAPQFGAILVGARVRVWQPALV